jgi:hypothetical protein
MCCAQCSPGHQGGEAKQKKEKKKKSALALRLACERGIGGDGEAVGGDVGMDAKKIVQMLRVEGLSIDASAVKWLLQWLARQKDNEVAAFEEVIRHLPKSSCTMPRDIVSIAHGLLVTSNVLNTEILNTTITGLSHNIDGQVSKHTLIVIPSTSFPHLRYNFTRNTFMPYARDPSLLELNACVAPRRAPSLVCTGRRRTRLVCSGTGSDSSAKGTSVVEITP